MGQWTTLELLGLALDALAALAVMAWVAWARKRLKADTSHAREQAAQILASAEREAESRRKEAELAGKERAHALLLEAERSARELHEAARTAEQHAAEQLRVASERTATLIQREQDLSRRHDEAQQRQAAQAAIEQQVRARLAQADERHAEAMKELQRVSGLTADEAKAELLRHVEHDARRDAAHLIKRLEAEAREQAGARARQIITEAIQRSAAEHAIETTVSVVDLPSDDMKGRIIGREGRNIRALEQATGVELIVDDTPGAIILSSFDPFRREVARQSIEKLIADGRIHPARIEEVVDKVRSELEDAVRRDGEAAAFELGLHDVHPELLRLMGRLKFRTSYGQNVLSHSKEVAFLAGVMARELGLDAHVSVRAAFLHDVGKAVDREMEGTHLEIGLDLLRKHGERPSVIDAVAAHHMDIDWPSLEAMIVQAADAISAARPGARRDILESYVKRLEKLEDIASSFKGVARSFALQAGREIRILVQSEQVSDEDAVWLSKDIARRIENELEYPGQIKVTVIRETRAVEIAR
ncbi:ribonuclease Y [Luteitalea sp. TBR-22]|uniref:ribonuclease Y n=1 Tax=Luteitalea sp. TBR-22 TaxID=2802971 RepID=UPI001AF5B944|nr:ribonuclease Y [Luteitalea sp. TBR-22]BCS32713.1 ribonuclease Y [Luteitalea sp. TBR-22]